MTSNKVNKIPNQFIITDGGTRVFQSYDTIIVEISYNEEGQKTIALDKDNWNYSRTTSKYRRLFLRENTAETRKKIESGKYVLVNLN